MSSSELPLQFTVNTTIAPLQVPQLPVLLHRVTVPTQRALLARLMDHLPQAAVEWVTFSAFPSDTHLVMVMVTADTSQCPGGSGTHRPLDTTKDTDSVLTEWEVALAVDMEEIPEDMAVQAEDMDDKLKVRQAVDTEYIEPLTRCFSHSSTFSSFDRLTAMPEMRVSTTHMLLQGLIISFCFVVVTVAGPHAQYNNPPC